MPCRAPIKTSDDQWSDPDLTGIGETWEDGGRRAEIVSNSSRDPDYWKGEVFAYVGLPQNLKDLKEKEAFDHL